MGAIPRAIPKSIYHGALNANALYYSFSPLGQVRSRLAPTLRRVAEALVISPHVTFDITNDITEANLPLALLVDFFGVATVRDLLQERALRFLCRSSTVQLSTEGSGSRHPLGLEADAMPGLADRDGERLARAALSPSARLQLVDPESIDAPTVAEMARLAAEVTDFPRQDTAAEAVQLATIALEQAPFWFQGKAVSDYPPNQIPDSHRSWALQLANDILSASVFREYELDFFEEEASWQSLIAVIDNVHSSEFILTATQRMWDLERVCSVRALLEQQVIQPAEILQIRRAEGAAAFRHWLWSQADPTNAPDIFAGYREALLRGKSNVADESWFRAVKVLAMEFVGSLLESVTTIMLEKQGVPPNVSDVGGRMARTGLDYCGEFLVDKIVRPPDPRRFADEIRRIEIERTIHSVQGPRLYRS